MFVHFAGCPVWGDEDMVRTCTCPRQWRIRKNRQPPGAWERHYCWEVFHRNDEGRYAFAVRAPSVAEAIDLVTAITAIADRNPLLSCFRGRK
jgi:hypothetical protein